MKLSARDQIIIGVVLTVLAAVAVFFLLILPRFGEIDAYEQELADIDAERTQVEATLKRRQDAKARAAETQVQLLDISSRFPEAPELPALIIELQDVANRIEIEFIQLAPGRPQTQAENADVSVIPVSVSITGTWEQYIEFMAALKNLRREIRVADFTLSSVPPPTEAEQAAAEGEDGGTTAGESDEEIVETYTIQARVNLEAYMMNSELSSGGGDAEGEQ